MTATIKAAPKSSLVPSPVPPLVSSSVSSPVALPGSLPEALYSLIRRRARDTHIAPRDVVPEFSLRRLICERVVSDGALPVVAARLGLAVAETRAATLDRWNSDLIGHPYIGLGHNGRPGWALVALGRFCPVCLREGRPWPLTHQLGTATSCLRHRTVLSAAARMARAVVGDPLEERVLWGPTRRASDAALDTQAECERLWALAPTDPDCSRFLTRLRALLALAVIAHAGDAAPAGEPALPSDLASLLTAQLSGTPGPGTRGGRHGAYLARPPSDVLLAAHLLPGALDAAVDGRKRFHAYVSAATRAAANVHPALPERLPAVIADACGDARPVPADPIGRYADQWHHLVDTAATRFIQQGRRGRHIPGALAADPLHDPAWAIGLARAALLHARVGGMSITASVEALGHPFWRVTAALRALDQTPPTSHDKSLFTELISRPAVDYRAARQQQSVVTSIAIGRLRLLSAPPPSHGRTTPGQIAALWLWVRLTGSGYISAPGFDARTTPGITTTLRDWDRRLTPEDRLHLYDANKEARAALTDLVNATTPTTTTTTTATVRAAMAPTAGAPRAGSVTVP